MTSHNHNSPPLTTIRLLALAVTFYRKNFLSTIGLFLQTLIVAFVLLSLFRSMASSILIETLLIVIAHSPFAVVVHRAIALGEPITQAAYFQGFARKAVWQFFGCALLLLLAVPIVLIIVMGIFMAISSMFPNDSRILTAIGTMLPYLTVFATGAYLFGFLYILPAVATGETKSPLACRKLMRGSTWRVFWACGLLSLPLAAMLAFIGAIKTRTEAIAALVTMLGLWVVIVPLCLAVLSFAYRHSTRSPG